jgi:DNA-binding transcriptional MocR family regulator
VGGDDGLNLWLPVADEAAALIRLASQGIAVAPGAPFAVLPEQDGHIRVTIASLGPDRDHVEHVLQDLAGATTAVGTWGRAR